MMRPSGLWPVSISGSSGHSQAWSVASKTAPRRLDATSSGHIMRKLRSSALSRKTSAYHSPSCISELPIASPGGRDVDGVLVQIGELEVLAQLPAVDVRVRPHPQVARRARRRRSPGSGRRSRRTAPPGRYERSHSSRIFRWPGSDFAFIAGTWCAFEVPSTLMPSTSFGPVQPLGDLQHDHRPARALGAAAAATDLLLELADLAVRGVERARRARRRAGRSGHPRSAGASRSPRRASSAPRRSST